MGKGTKRKKADYHSHRKSKKSKSPFTLEPGLKGFICTCNNREKECVRESYNILNEYADQLYGEEKWEKTTTADNAENSDEDDIDEALQQEVDHLKAERAKDPKLRRFQVVESGANNCLFIRTTVDDPVKLTSTIFKDLDETKKQKTRYLLRMIPIEATCKAWPEDIQTAADKLLDKYFLGGEKKSFSVVFNRRNNSNVPRDDVIHEIAAGVRQRNPLHYADLKTPQLAIIVEIIRNMCCLAVVPDYFKYRRCNLLEICTVQNVSDKEISNSEGATIKQEENSNCETAVKIQDGNSEAAVEIQDGNSEAAVEIQDGNSEAAVEIQDGNSEAAVKIQGGNNEAAVKVQDGNSEAAVVKHDETGNNEATATKQDNESVNDK